MTKKLSRRMACPLAVVAGVLAISTSVQAQIVRGREPVMMQAFGPLVQQAQGLQDAMVAHIDVPELEGTIGIRLPLPGHEKNVTLKVNNVSIRSENYRLIAQTANGDYVDLDPGPSLTFQGTIPEIEGATVVGSRLPTGVLASIILENGKRFFVQPVSDSIPGMDAGLHVIYRGEDVICPEGACGTTALHQVGDIQQEGEGGVAGSCSGGVCIADIACDADFEFYGLCGSTTQGTQNRIESILNVVNHQYVRELNIAHRVVSVIVRTSEPDPYSSTNPDTLLSQFRTQWNNNHSGIGRDVAHLFTGKNIDGSTIGIAYIGVICASLTTGSGYGLSQSFYSSTFSCQTDLTAHELGHNWNAQHCTCSTTTMNPSITCANTFIGSGSSSVSQIDAHRDSRTCLANGGIRPANDVCTTATTIFSGGTYNGSNANATTTGGTDLCTGASGSWGGGERDVWWRFTAHISGTWTVTTCGSNFDTVLSIYTGCPGGLNNDVACNDDAVVSCSGTLQSAIQFTATAGQVYYIRVAGYAGAVGAITLNVTPPLALLNTCSLAGTVTSGQVIFGSLFNAGTEGTASCGSTAGNRARWFSFTAPCNGTLTVSTCGTHDDGEEDSGMDTVLAIYSGCPGSTGNQLACNDDGVSDPCGSLDNGLIRDSYITLPMTAGQNVRIRLSHFFNSIVDGRFEFRVTYASVASPPVVNAIADLTHAPCTSSFTGPTPSVLTPSCMTGVTWSLQLGPPGMTINSATGVVTWPSPAQGGWLVRIRATNALGFDDEDFILQVTPLAPVLVNILNATRACGSPPYVGPTPQFTNPNCMNNSASYSLITGPPGMTINSSTGVVTWPNPVSGVHSINIRVTTSVGTDDEPWTLTVTNRSPNLDGAGTVGAADLGILLGSWGFGSPPADLNCDGVVNAGDLGILLGAWGTSGFAPFTAPPGGMGHPGPFGDLVGNFGGGNGGFGDGAEGDAANPAQPVDIQPLATGGVLKLAGGWTPAASDRLLIHIAGIEPVTGHDLLVVEGRALLNGRLLIDLGDHFTPQIGDEITFLAAGELAGQFQDVLIPAMPADRCMDLMYGQQMVTARVLPCDPVIAAIIQPTPGARAPAADISADLTMDRIIDVHDLSLLLDRWGTTDPLADLSGNGIVDGADVRLLLEQWTGR